jgi:hypothetical protein
MNYKMREAIAVADSGPLIALGGEVREGAGGSRVMLEISGKREYAHRPHPGKEAKRYIVERIREWLISLEVTP